MGRATIENNVMYCDNFAYVNIDDMSLISRISNSIADNIYSGKVLARGYSMDAKHADKIQNSYWVRCHELDKNRVLVSEKEAIATL